MSFSYGLGVAQYHGDMHDVLYDGLSAATGYSFGLGLSKKVGDVISIRFDINHYQIGGDDAETGSIRPPTNSDQSREVRNLRFRARNWEFNFQTNLFFIPVKGSYSRRPLVNPYLIAGVGYTTSNPKAQDPLTGQWQNLRPLNTEIGFAKAGEQEKLMRLVVPLGIGVRIKANRYIDILIEGARRFTFTDYLDDVSTQYPSEAAIRAYHQQNSPELEEIAVRLFDRSAEGGFRPRPEGAVRGNPGKNDAYYIFQVRLDMYIPDSVFGNLFGRARGPKFR